MLSIAYYFLQVVFCSAVMMGYYWLVLRDKKFHQYNRFYLISVLLLSWIIPLIKIQWTKPVTSNAQVINFLSIVADNNAEIDANIAKSNYQWTWEGIAVDIYFVMAAIMLGLLIIGFVRLYVLLKKHSCKNVGDVYLILTQVKGTPFSFFRYIFWHEAIDLRSDAGKKMLVHELTHVQQKHSIDKVLIQVVLVAGWFNPFFWLLKKEMEMIHEFIADNKSVQDGDSASLAQLLLTAAYPQQQFLLTTPFFFSPIKRRLAMITNHKNPRFSYLRRLVILPILALVVILVAFRKKETELTLLPSIQLNKTYTIVIDAGHGGKDRGAQSAETKITEAEITLKFAKAVQASNTNPNIKIVLTRETDVFNSVEEKANFANAQKADLFISLHCNNVSTVLVDGKTFGNSTKGIEIYIADKTKANDYMANANFANDLGNAIKNVNPNLLGIKSRKAGIWVLQAVKCPSALIETGFISNQEDLKLMLDAEYQKKFAASILEGIQSYLTHVENGINDTKTVIIQDGNKNITVTNLVLSDPSTNKEKAVLMPGSNKDTTKEPLVILDGKIQPKGAIKKIEPNTIDKIEVLKNEAAVIAYGDAGKNGVILITSKVQIKDIKLEKANFANIGTNGIQTIHLLDNKVLYYIDGLKSDSTAMHQLDPDQIASMSIWKGEKAIMKYGQDGENGVVDVKTKKSTSDFSNQDVKVFTQVEIPAEFPGGTTAFAKYLERNLKTDFLTKQQAPPGKYTVVVAFQVNENGSLNNVQAQNDPGYGTKETAENLIKKGPSWKPAIQNLKPVNSIQKQSITFVVPEKK
jgi:N-acetylmuramoyl-L-alanine amidase